MEPVAVIEAYKLLEWLRGEMKEARKITENTRIGVPKEFYQGYVTAMQDVIDYVEDEKYLVDKEREEE